MNSTFIPLQIKRVELDRRRTLIGWCLILYPPYRGYDPFAILLDLPLSFCVVRKMNILTCVCQGMTKSVKVHGKDQSVNKNAYFTILASFVCFFNFSDRNLIILCKIT